MSNRTSSTRRAVLQAAASAAPLLATPQSASQKIRMGFIGLGRQGRNCLRSALMQAQIEVVALSEIYPPNLDAALEIAPDAKVYADFRELIAANNIDAVCVATPDHWHAYMAIEACKAGKDVYVEKPISVTIQEGKLMVEAARKYGRVVQVGTQQRSGKHFQEAVRMIRDNKIGDITFVRTWNYGNAYPNGIGNPADSAPPPGLDWDMWLGPARERPFNKNRFGVDPNAFSHFRWFWDYAGGMMTDWGIHLLDIVLWAMDEPGPRVVSGHGAKYVLNDNRETPDTIQVTYEFPKFLCVYENRVANRESLWGRNYGIAFHGTRGTMFVDRGRWEVYPEKKRVRVGEEQEEVPLMEASESERSNNSLQDHWANFVNCVKTRENPISDIEVGHRSTATAILGNIAMRSRQRVEWDPWNYSTDNPEAASYLDRPYRDPWKLTL